MYRAARAFDVHGPRHLYKEYGPSALDRLDEDALRRLVSWRAGLSGRDGQAVLRHCALPSHLVTFEGTVRGFLMPEAPPAYLWTTATGHVAERPDGQRVARTGDEMGRDSPYTNEALQFKYETYSTAHQFGLLGHLLYITNTLHGQGIVLGDLQPKNFLVTLHDVRPSVFFVDCDSFSLGGRAPISGLEPESWQTHAGAGVHNRLTDYAKFSLLVFRTISRQLWSDPDFYELNEIVPATKITLLRRMWDLDSSVTQQELASFSNWMRGYELQPRRVAGALRRIPRATKHALVRLPLEPNDGLEGYDMVNPHSQIPLRSSHKAPQVRRFNTRPRIITGVRLALGFVMFVGVIITLALLGFVRV